MKPVPAGVDWDPNGSDWEKDLSEPTPELPPGPAFIPLPHVLQWPYMTLKEWASENVPDDYTWQDATESTGAGWVRPHGSARVTFKDYGDGAGPFVSAEFFNPTEENSE